MSPRQLFIAFRQKQIPLASRAIAFVAMVCLCLIGIELIQTLHTYQIQREQTESAANNLNHSVAQHVYDTFKETDVVLDSVVDTIENARAENHSLDAYRDFLVRRADSLPQIDGLFIYDEHGEWLINSSTTETIRLNIADRNYFVHHQQSTDSQLYIGPPIQSRLTGEWILTLSRRLSHRNGSFAGVALAAIRMQYFQDFYEQLDTGRDGAIIVTRKDGVVLMRKPFDASILGKNISGNNLFRQYVRFSDAGIAVNKSFIDGITRINSYRMLKSYPLLVSAALSKEEAFEEWQTDTAERGLAVSILIFIIAATGYRLAKQILLRTIAEKQLRDAHIALEQANAALNLLVTQDGLTGLSSRREFDTVLEREFSRAMRQATPLSLIMIDVDFFKQYNDTYGHPAGDECLKAVSAVINNARKRSVDLSARYGGEEMVVLLPDTPEEGAMQVAEQIRTEICQLAIPHAKSLLGVVTVSLGVSTLVPQLGRHSATALIAQADVALYQAKNTGRNRVVAAIH